MRASLFTISLVAASAMADKLAYTNTNTNSLSFAAMLKRGDMLLKRQGYTPDTVNCGRGETCEEACGANSVECPSSDSSTLYCHLSNDGSTCCPDGSGNSCDAGYYCTSDSVGETYCCPDGVDTGNCALQYSLSVSLIRQTATPTPSATPLDSTVAAETPVSSSQRVSSAGATTRTSAAGTASKASTAATAATSAPAQATGGAAKVMGAGAAVFVGALGFAGLF